MGFFNSLVKELREEHGVSQRELAKLTGIHRGAIRRIERGNGGPISTLVAIVSVLAISLSPCPRKIASRQRARLSLAFWKWGNRSSAELRKPRLQHPRRFGVLRGWPRHCSPLPNSPSLAWPALL